MSHVPKPIPENQLDEILEGRHILKQLEDSKAPIAAFAREHQISRSKIYRLKQKQVLGTTALADGRHKNKGRPVKIHEKAVAWVFCCLAEYPRMKLSQMAEKLKEACQRHNIQAPSYDQLRRLIKNTPKDLVSFLTKRYEDFYEDDCLKVRRHFGYPLQLVQMDSTMLDIYVMDPITGEVYRPWFTAGIDMYTRVLVGFYLHKDAPSARTSTAALKRIILPKGRDDLPFYGKMETITVDQHGSNIAGHLKSQMVNMGINYVANDPQCSDENGGIERWFRTIKEGLLATLPGYTEQPDAMARAKKGCLTEAMLLKRLYRWLLK
jgi:putative transposase